MKILRTTILACALMLFQNCKNAVITEEKTNHTESRLVKPFALTPPMGWNSWNCFGPEVNEK